MKIRVIFKIFFLVVMPLIYLNTAKASIFEPTADEIQQNIREFVLESIRQDESFSHLADLVQRVAFEKKSTKTIMRRPGCGAVWSGDCPKLAKEKNVITTRSYLAYGKDFTCRVKGIWQWSRFDGSQLAIVDVNCF